MDGRDRGPTIVLRTDGASRGNPGHAAAGVVLADAQGNVLVRDAAYLGVLTNNQAEYRALILGLRAAARYNPSSVRVYMDSELVVRQMRGEYKVKHDLLRQLYEEACAAARALPHVTFANVPRSQNADADALANAALNEHARLEREQRAATHRTGRVANDDQDNDLE
jgi:ribonuclease HI